MNKLWLFLYSNGNILGSSFALLGLILHFSGILNQYWFLIICGLYLAGYLIAPSSRVLINDIEDNLSFHELNQKLINLVRKINKKLPNQAQEHLSSIQTSYQNISSRLNKGETIVDDHLRITLRRMVEDYIPETLSAYLHLPKAYAKVHVLRDGKTANQILIDQLALLAQEMTRLENDFFAQDSHKLLTHGRLLSNLFERSDKLF